MVSEIRLKLTVDTAQASFTTSYRPIRLLSEHGATSVILCENNTSRELVVVKHSSQEMSSNKTVESRVAVPTGMAQQSIVLNVGRDSIAQELQVAHLLQNMPHPHIVTILDSSENASHTERSATFLAMEYCPNGDLFSLLEQQPNRSFTEADALQYFRQITQGAHHLHQLGIAHRDISLENVLIDSQGRAKICDFGLSIETAIRCCGCVGKLQYMAPEVAAGGEYDPVLADVWSLGALLFIMLTGSPLFGLAVPSDPAWGALQRSGVSGILSHWGLSANVSQSTVDLVSAMLRIDPSQRPQSLIKVLERIPDFGR